MGDGRGPEGRPLPLRWVSAFGRFWWEFLIGDTPGLFVGAAAVIGVVALICVHPGARTFAAYLMPVLVALVVGLSVRRASRQVP
jgi:hypothetical protein